MSTPALEIAIASDIVCPWCYIGKRRLETALNLWQEQHPELPPPTLRWLPFQLNPDMPATGMSRADYLRRKFGSADGGSRYERVRQEAEKEGLAIRFEQIQHMPNTLQAHALVEVAYQHGVQAQVKEALMRAFFCEAVNLTQSTELIRIATAAGLPEAAAVAALSDAELLRSIEQQDAQLRAQGVQGVPFFVLNNTYGVSGAQSPAALVQAFEQALQAASQR